MKVDCPHMKEYNLNGLILIIMEAVAYVKTFL
jgi:hypothetical protein